MNKFKQKKFNQYEQLLNSAIGSLSIRDHTIRALREKLLTKTDKPDLVQPVLDRCLEFGYLKTDDKFAVHAASVGFRNDYGESRVRSDLKKHGIDAHHIDNGVATAMEDVGYDEQISLVRRLGAYHDLTLVTRDAIESDMTKYGFKRSDVDRHLRDRDDYSKLKTKAQLKGESADLEKEIVKLAKKGKGGSLIKMELRAKFVDVSEFDRVLSELEADGSVDFFDLCVKALEKKRYDLNDYKGRSTAYGFLTQKGFNKDQINHAIEIVKG